MKNGLVCRSRQMGQEHVRVEEPEAIASPLVSSLDRAGAFDAEFGSGGLPKSRRLSFSTPGHAFAFI